MKSKDKFGDRIKSMEMAWAGAELPPGHICIRLDGKGFSSFTKDLARPYDIRLSNIMTKTMNHLLMSYHLDLGYTQSDEISFFIKIDDNPLSKTIYRRRIQKLTSILASEATSFFINQIYKEIPEKFDSLPKFDCRVWIVPDLDDVADVFVWRLMDCTKNSISMAAHHHFGHKKTLGKKSSKKIKMLEEKGVSWNNYPDFFKYGTFVIKKNVEQKIPEELKNYPSNKGKETFIRATYRNFSIALHHEVYSLIRKNFDYKYPN